jgi:hypothetical protein
MSVPASGATRISGCRAAASARTASVSLLTRLHRTDDLPITSRMLRVDLDGSRRIEPAHVGCVVGPDGSRPIQTDRVDDQMDDQGASDTTSDAKAS